MEGGGLARGHVEDVASRWVRCHQGKGEGGVSPGEGEDVALRWVGCHQGGFEVGGVSPCRGGGGCCFKVGGVSPGEGEDVALRWVGCHQGRGRMLL